VLNQVRCDESRGADRGAASASARSVRQAPASRNCRWLPDSESAGLPESSRKSPRPKLGQPAQARARLPEQRERNTACGIGRSGISPRPGRWELNDPCTCFVLRRGGSKPENLKVSGRRCGQAAGAVVPVQPDLADWTPLVPVRAGFDCIVPAG
jgi:hypothetical protein